jgi:predicted acetyltransferase
VALSIVKPDMTTLSSYLEALEEGPFCNMALGFGDVPLPAIMADREGYLHALNHPASFYFNLPDGSQFQITDHELYWIADGTRYIGSLAMRYKGDAEMVENFCGHIGMAIRPALLQRGYGVKALVNIFALGGEIVKEKGLQFLLTSCDAANKPSMRLIEHAGGKLWRSHDSFHGTPANLIYKFDL